MSKIDLNSFAIADDDEVKSIKNQIKIFDDLKTKEKASFEKAEEVKAKRIIAERILYDLLKSVGFESIKTKLGTFSRRDDWYASFDKDKKREGFQWLSDLGYEDLIHETINANTFAAFIKELKLKEKVEIPDFVNITIMKKIGVTKKK